MNFTFGKHVFIPALLLVSLSAVGRADSPINAGNEGKGQSAESNAPDPAKIVHFLSQTVSWYRQLAVEQKQATDPADVTFVQENRRVADQLVQQAFEYARGQAQTQSRQPQAQSQASTGANSSQYQALTQGLQKVEQEFKDTQTELQTTREKLAAAPAVKKRILQSQVDELQSELGLLDARRDALQSMVEFVNTSSSGSGNVGLRAQIEELARTVPAALTRAQGGTQGETTPELPSSASASLSSKTQPYGVWGLATNLIHLSGKIHTLNDELASTGELEKTSKELQQPLIDDLKNLIGQGDQLFAAADVAGPSQLEQQKRQLDALAAQFRQTSTGLLPLSKVGVLLGIYENTLRNWKESVRDEEHDELRQLLLRLALLALLIGLVFGSGEIWRRATFRYVHDTRRRYQFLLLRRVVIWLAVGLILVLTFATQLGSAVTFAGLLTAGVAVALQNVIVSVVGYFFLIGKYGIRVGDRVQIAGVTGEVVDIGLARIHLMELGGPGENQPSGRIVAFSNSIVFQPTPGLFKQIPGTNFVWHELKLTLAAETDYNAARDRITETVNSVLTEHQKTMETQRQLMERNLNTVSSADLQAKIRLHYAASGIEVTIRYPVAIEKASEMDDLLMHELLAALGREPKLKLVSAEMPMAKAGD